MEETENKRNCADDGEGNNYSADLFFEVFGEQEYIDNGSKVDCTYWKNGPIGSAYEKTKADGDTFPWFGKFELQGRIKSNE